MKTELEVDSRWIGQNYADGWNGVRLLVLGESSYGSHATAPRLLVERHICGDAKHWGRTYTKFLQLLGYRHRQPLDTDQRRLMWGRLAFFNYLTDAAATGPRMKPSREAWSKSLPAFSIAVATLSPLPDGIIVWGHRLWHALEKTCGCLEGYGDNRGHIALADGRNLPAFALKHPSHPSARIDEWAPKLSRFIDDLRGGLTRGQD